MWHKIQKMPTGEKDYEESVRARLRAETGICIQQWLTHLLSCSMVENEWISEERWIKRIPYDLDYYITIMNKPLSRHDWKSLEAMAASFKSAHAVLPSRRPKVDGLIAAVADYGKVAGLDG